MADVRGGNDVNPLNWFRHIDAKLAEIAAANKRKREIARREVIKESPKPDERSSIAMHERIVNRTQ